MAYTAVSRNIPIAPRKLRLIARILRGKTVGAVDQTLRLYQKKGARLLRQALQTAVHNGRLSAESRIVSLEVGEGMKLRRQYLFGRGITRPYFKQRSHLRIVFDDTELTHETRSPKSEPRQNMASNKTKKNA